MIPLLLTICASAENGTVLDSLNTFKSIDVEVQAKDLFYLNLTTHTSSSLQRARVAAFVTSDNIPNNLEISFVTANNEISNFPKIFYEISKTNPGFIFSVLATNDERTYILIRNTGEQKISFTFAFGVLEIDSFTAYSYFSTSNYDCFSTNRDEAGQESDHVFASEDEVTYVNLHKKSPGAVYSVNFHVNHNRDTFQDTFEYYSETGTKEIYSLNGKMTFPNPVYRFKAAKGSYSDIIYALEFESQNSNSKDYDGMICSAEFTNNKNVASCTKKTNNVCREYQLPETTSAKAKRILIIVCVVYFSIVLILLAIVIVMGILNPNNMQKIGFPCAFCFLCCTNDLDVEFDDIDVSRNAANETQEKLCGCLFSEDTSSKRENTIMTIILVVILVTLVFIAFFLIYMIVFMIMHNTPLNENKTEKNQNKKQNKKKSLR